MVYSVKFHPDITMLKEIKHSTEEKLKRWKIPYMDLMDILLAIDESITNIITHGYDKIVPSDYIELEIVKDIRQINIQITDSGKPFDFSSTPLPDVRKNLAGKRKGGFGVHLIKSVMDSVNHERLGNKNILTLKKLLSNDKK